PLAQIHNNRTRIQFVLRSSLPPPSQIEPVRQALRRIEPAAGLEVGTLYSSIGLAFLPSQVGAVLLGSTGVLGLLLAAVGLYGVVAYAVTSRTREIGIRIAVGAARRDIARMVLLDSARLTGTGCAIGLFIAFFVTRPLAMFLVAGLNPTDPANYSVVIAVLILAGLAATWGPMRRAMQIDPLSALRYE
ncbi:MAG: FtsX-like permease family protein, partial [Bryobacteraceae bacterium]